MTDLFHVRQYTPSFFDGFETSVAHAVPYGDITKQPWLEHFRRGDFMRFDVEPYGKELVISAVYSNGTHLVVGFAISINSPAISDENLAMTVRYKLPSVMLSS